MTALILSFSTFKAIHRSPQIKSVLELFMLLVNHTAPLDIFVYINGVFYNMTALILMLRVRSKLWKHTKIDIIRGQDIG
jgi:hypothetical protein